MLHKKVVPYQTAAMFYKPVNPTKDEKHFQVQYAVHSRDAPTDHDYALTPAGLCLLCPLCPLYSTGEGVYADNFSVGLFHRSSALVRLEGRQSGTGNPALAPRPCSVALSSREPLAPTSGRDGERYRRTDASHRAALGGTSVGGPVTGVNLHVLSVPRGGYDAR